MLRKRHINVYECIIMYLIVVLGPLPLPDEFILCEYYVKTVRTSSNTRPASHPNMYMMKSILYMYIYIYVILYLCICMYIKVYKRQTSPKSCKKQESREKCRRRKNAQLAALSRVSTCCCKSRALFFPAT